MPRFQIYKISDSDHDLEKWQRLKSYILALELEKRQVSEEEVLIWVLRSQVALITATSAKN